MTTTVPRRHRRDNREAERNRDQQLDLLARQIEVDLAGVPSVAPVARTPWRERERLPVARPVMTNPKGEIAWAVGHVANRTGHHFFRLDLHARTFWCAFGRGCQRGYGWVRDYVKMPSRQAVLVRLIAAGETEKHAKLAASYEKRKKLRKQKVAAGAGGVAVAFLVVLLMLGPWATLAALVLAGPPVVAIYGRKRDKGKQPVMQLDTRPIPKAEGRPSPDLIHQAFHESGIKGITVVTAPHRVGGGWETIVRIPVGTQTFDDAVKNQAAIAGNLETTSECLFLTPVRGPGGSTKHVRIWYTKTDPFLGDPPPHPLLDPKNHPADLWDSGLPIGIDARGTVARIAVTDTPFVLVVGQPGSGKTFLLFGIGAAIAADPLWDLDCWTFKDSGSFAPLEPLVKACGGTYDYGSDRKAIDRFVRYLIRILDELKERNRILDGLPFQENPKDKVERNLAARPGSRHRPRLVFADEFLTPIKADNRVLPLMHEIARTARSQHIVFVCCSHEAGKKTFDDLQGLFGARICLSVDQHDDAETALGGYYVSGLTEAHRIPLSEKAVAYVGGSIVDPEIGPRPAYKIHNYGIADRQALADHIARCFAGPRAHQVAPKVTLTKPDPETAAFRSKVADLFGPGETALTCMVLGQRLGLGQGNWAGRRFADQAREHGIEPQTDADGKATGSRGALYVALDQVSEVEA
jgi:hypothetical protein